MPPPSPDQAGAYESQNVHDVYAAIAPHFAATRYALWPAIDTFLASIPQHAVIAGVGCGNGLYLLVTEGSPNRPCPIGTEDALRWWRLPQSKKWTGLTGEADLMLELPTFARCLSAIARV